VLVVGGVAVGTFSFVKVFVDQSRNISAFDRGPVPRTTLHLERGDFTIFLEGDGITDEDGNENCRLCDAVRQSDITITGPDGRLDTPPYGGENTYDLGHEGVALATVHVAVEADYDVVVDPAIAQIREVAIGEYDFFSSFKQAGIGMGILFAGLFIGIPMIRFGRRGR
jgi:hypothetical protein